MALLLLAAAAAGLYAAVLTFLWFRQESLLFFPEPLPADHRLASEPGVEEVAIDVPGARLSVLHLKVPASRGVVFFLHGNGGNLASWFTGTEFYRQASFDLVMMDYRGYGKSTGRITDAAGLRTDVRAVWDHFAPQYAGRRIVVYGRSLGTALAADLAGQLSLAGAPPDLTVLVSPYFSMRALRDDYYPWVPPFLLRYPLDTSAHLPRVRGPVILVHGDQDEVIALRHAHRLKDAFPLAKLLVVAGAAHNDIHETPVYRAALLAALRALPVPDTP